MLVCKTQNNNVTQVTNVTEATGNVAPIRRVQDELNEITVELQDQVMAIKENLDPITERLEVVDLLVRSGQGRGAGRAQLLDGGEQRLLLGLDAFHDGRLAETPPQRTDHVPMSWMC